MKLWILDCDHMNLAILLQRGLERKADVIIIFEVSSPNHKQKAHGPCRLLCTDLTENGDGGGVLSCSSIRSPIIAPWKFTNLHTGNNLVVRWHLWLGYRVLPETSVICHRVANYCLVSLNHVNKSRRSGFNFNLITVITSCFVGDITVSVHQYTFVRGNHSWKSWL